MSKFWDKLKKVNFHRLFSDPETLQYGAIEKPKDPNIWRGKFITIDGCDLPVKVEKIVGNVADPRMFEINGAYLVPMLDFYLQVYENRRPTKEELAQFMSFEVVQIDVPAPKKKEDLN